MTFLLADAKIRRVAVVAGAMLALAGCSSLETQDPNAPPPELAAAATAAFSADPAVFDVLDEAVAEAGTDPEKLHVLERHFVELLRARETTPAGRQEIALRLGSILQATKPDGDSPALKVLAAMLREPATVAVARLALEPVRGEHVDDLFVGALEKTSGSTRVAIIQAIGAREIERAVPEIAALIDDSDPATAGMAIRVLGEIDGEEALAVLENAGDANRGPVLDARLAAAARADGPTAARAYEAIIRDGSIDLSKRAIALRGILGARPQSALGQIHEALLASEPAFHEVAIEAIRELPDSATSATLAGNLGKYTPAVQAAVIEALGYRGDDAAVPGLRAIVKSPDPAVTAAAIDALGRLPGDIETAETLATIALGSGDLAQAAMDALARLDGEGIDAMVTANAASGEIARRSVFIRLIAARNLTEAIPFLLGLRTAPELSLRLDALDALREIAQPENQNAVLDWALGCDERSEKTRAIRALIAITLRDDAVETRGASILAEMAGGTPETRLTLMPVLSRIEGDGAIATARSIALTAESRVAAAAITELTRWPDGSALVPLVEIAETVSDVELASQAILGAARLIERGDLPNHADICTMAMRLLRVQSNAVARNRSLVLLRQCSDEGAIEAASRFMSDPATSAEATNAVDAIQANMAWPPLLAASAEVDSVANAADGNESTVWRVPGSSGAWLRLDLKHSRPLTRIILDQGRDAWNFPSAIEAYVSETNDQPAQPAAKAAGERDSTIIHLPPETRGRYIWLLQTGSREQPWTVAEITVE